MDSLPEFSVLPVADLILSDIAIMRYHRPEVLTTDTVSVTEEVDSTQSVQG